MTDYVPEVAEFTAQQIDAAIQAAGTPIGSGPCGPVYKCHLSGLEVAIKILSTLNTSKDEHTAAAAVDFKAHVDMLSRLSHDSLLPLMGCCPERQALVFPYMPGGNLIDRLGPAHPNGRLWWQDRVQIIYEVAGVLLWLQQRGMRHGNLKPTNVQLDSYDEVQVADLDPAAAATHAATDDLQALGVIMHLLLTGEPPSDNLTTQIPNTLDPELTDEGLLETLRPHLDPSASWPDNQAAAIARLAAACIGKMSAVTSDIEGLLLDKDVYPVLERLQSDTAATLSSDDDGDSSADAEADVGPATAAGIRGETKTSAAAILRSKTWSKPPTGPSSPPLLTAVASATAADREKLHRLYTQQRQYSISRRYSFQKQYSFQRRLGSTSFYQQLSSSGSKADPTAAGGLQARGSVPSFRRQFSRQMSLRSTNSAVLAAASSDNHRYKQYSTKNSSNTAVPQPHTSSADGLQLAAGGSSSSSHVQAAELVSLELELFSSDRDIQARAMCQLTNVAADDPTYGQTIATRMLHMLATSDDEEVLTVAAAVVADLAQMDLVTSSATAAAAPGVLRKLILMLGSTNVRAQYAAAGALGVLAAINPGNQAQIAAESKVWDDLIKLMGSLDAGIQEVAVLALGNLVRGQADYQTIVAAKPGLVSQLVAMLDNSNEGIQEVAALALGNLAIGNPETQAAVAAVASVFSRLSLLLSSSSSNGAVVQQAAFALGALVDGTTANQAAAVAGAPSIFIQLATLISSNNSSSSNDDAQETALCTLGQLVSNNPSNQAILVAEVPELFTLLVSLLSGSADSSSSACSSSSIDDIKLRALMLLAVLAENSPSNQAAVAAVPRVMNHLTVSLSCSNPTIQQHAAFLIAILACSDPANQAAAAAIPGALGQLVSLLSSTAEFVQQNAACAIWALAADNPVNQADISAVPGVYNQLVVLLSSTAEDVQAHAVRALYELTCSSPANQAAAAAVPGVFEQLAAVLTSSNEVVQMLAALALWSLAASDAASQAAIAAVPGVLATLINILGNLLTDEATQDAVAGLLLCLSYQGEVLQAAVKASADITENAAALLSSSTPEVQVAGAALLQNMACASSGSKAAIAGLPGVWNKVLALLRSHNDRVHMHAAALVAVLAERVPAVAAAVAAYPAMLDALGVLMNSSNPAVQEAAAVALGALAAVEQSVVGGFPFDRVEGSTVASGRLERFGSVMKLKGSKQRGSTDQTVRKKGLAGLVRQMKGALHGVKL